MRARVSVGAAAVVGLLAVIIHLPSLTAPFVFDDFNSIYQAGRALKDSALLWDPWMGGAFRLLPKLVLVAGLEVWGPEPGGFRFVNLLLHGLSCFLLTRRAGEWTGAARGGLWAGGLFALGFGFYGRAVLQISNVTMLLDLPLVLAGFGAYRAGRLGRSALCYALAIAAHEIAIVAPLLLPLLPPARALDTEAGGRGGVAPAPGARRAIPAYAVASLVVGAALLASLLPGWFGRFAVREISYPCFMLVPVNPSAFSLASIAPAAFADAMRRLVEFLVALQPWFGFALLGGSALAFGRLRPAGRLAILWVYAFFLPAAALSAGAEGAWMQRRYLYFPSAGLCLLAAVAWGSGGGGGRARWALVVSVIAWTLAWSGLSALKLKQDGVEARGLGRTFAAEMARLDPRWRYDEE